MKKHDWFGAILALLIGVAVIGGFGYLLNLSITQHNNAMRSTNCDDPAWYADETPFAISDLTLAKTNQQFIIEFRWLVYHTEDFDVTLNEWHGLYKNHPCKVYELVSTRQIPGEPSFVGVDKLVLTKSVLQGEVQLLGDQYQSYLPGQSRDGDPKGPLIFIVTKVIT